MLAGLITAKLQKQFFFVNRERRINKNLCSNMHEKLTQYYWLYAFELVKVSKKFEINVNSILKF